MAPLAVEPVVQALALVQLIRVGFERLALHGDDPRRRAGHADGHDLDVVERGLDGRVGAQLALLALAGRQRQDQRERKPQPGHGGSANTYRAPPGTVWTGTSRNPFPAP